MDHSYSVKCFKCSAEMFTYCAPYKTAWYDPIKRSIAGDRLFCSEMCMRQSLRDERKNRLRKLALEVAKSLYRVGLDSATSETVWRMAAPKLYVHNSKRTDGNGLSGGTTYFLSIESF